MRHTYTVYALDEEPAVRFANEFGHEVIGVFDSFDAAKAIAEQYKQYDNVIIMENCLFGLTGASWQSVSHKHRSKEVWRWCAENDEFCS